MQGCGHSAREEARPLPFPTVYLPVRASILGRLLGSFPELPPRQQQHLAGRKVVHRLAVRCVQAPRDGGPPLPPDGLLLRVGPSSFSVCSTTSFFRPCWLFFLLSNLSGCRGFEASQHALEKKEERERDPTGGAANSKTKRCAAHACVRILSVVLKVRDTSLDF